MSYAVARMQKMKSPDLKGIQFHNQRERESRTNNDIDKERSYKNYDLVNSENINYNERVKSIIESQKIDERKTRKDAVLVNELMITSDKNFFDRLPEEEQKRFFEESYKLFSERYGEQNIAYATVHNDEKTPHMHLGVVPMKDGRLQGKNVFNRQELLWLQDKFPKHMQEQGFDLERGERGSDRKHLETSEFKKQTLEKEISFLEKDLSVKKDELSVFSESVESDIKVSAEKEMQDVEVPTGEKNLFGKEKTRIEQQPTQNVIISQSDYDNLLTAVNENKKLKTYLTKILSTDMAKQNNYLVDQNKKLNKRNNFLVEKFNTAANKNKELVKENKTLKSKISDLKQEIGSVYKTTKLFLKERTDNLKAFKNVFNDLVNKVKEESPKGEFRRLGNKEKERERDDGMSL